jgi:hypothetical protein
VKKPGAKCDLSELRFSQMKVRLVKSIKPAAFEIFGYMYKYFHKKRREANLPSDF